MPAVQEIVGPAVEAAGFKSADLMTLMMQIKAFGAQDASIQADTDKLMKAVQGDLSDFA